MNVLGFICKSEYNEEFFRPKKLRCCSITIIYIYKNRRLKNETLTLDNLFTV